MDEQRPTAGREAGAVDSGDAAQDVHAAHAAHGAHAHAQGAGSTVGAVGCALLSQRWGEPLAGSAAQAHTWLAIEQPGPYGADALTESHLDPRVGAEIARVTAGTGVRPQLIRRAGRHADQHLLHPRREVLIAHTCPGATWLEQTTIEDPACLLELDFAALGAGVPPGIGERTGEPVLLVCTNGRRDVCCAVRGRAVIEELQADDIGQVWETTHTGGHRFAPTGVLLPSGYLYGRLTAGTARELVTRARVGKLGLDGCRGRSTWSPSGQVAELAIRERLRDERVDGVRVIEELHDTPGEAGAPARCTVRVEVDGGDLWTVRLAEHELLPARRTSCAKEPVVPTAWVAEDLTCDG